MAVIAEIKRRSPSKGPLNVELDPVALAMAYADGGATALSVLTDEEHFGGSIDDLKTAREAVSLPVLRKDFTVDARDVLDARLMGADAVLLIAAALDRVELADLVELGADVGIDALVEVHDEWEMEIAVNAGVTLVGVNQRDLHTFDVDTNRAVRVAKAMPEGLVKVAESGIRTVDDAKRLRDVGYDAVLVGESIVTSSNPSDAVNALRSV